MMNLCVFIDKLNDTATYHYLQLHVDKIVGWKHPFRIGNFNVDSTIINSSILISIEIIWYLSRRLSIKFYSLKLYLNIFLVPKVEIKDKRFHVCALYMFHRFSSISFNLFPPKQFSFNKVLSFHMFFYLSVFSYAFFVKKSLHMLYPFNFIKRRWYSRRLQWI